MIKDWVDLFVIANLINASFRIGSPWAKKAWSFFTEDSDGAGSTGELGTTFPEENKLYYLNSKLLKREEGV